MSFGQVFDDRQPQTCSAQVSGTGAIDAVEPFKEPLQMLGRNTIARILDQYSISVAILIPNGYTPTFTVEFDRVVNQVG